MKMSGHMCCGVFMFLAVVASTEPSLGQLITENILINVTAGTVTDTPDSNNLQLSLNISVGDEQVLVNEVPVELSGVTRLNCSALLLDGGNASSEAEGGDVVSTVTRVMVIQNRLYSDSEEVLALQVFSEVIEMEGKKVQQPEMCEVKLLISPDFQKLDQFVNVYPIGHSEIFKVPREKDVVVTQPPGPRREDQVVSHTTSQSPLRHSETTRQEFAAPGKLPETPLRMDRDQLRDLIYNGEYEDGAAPRDASEAPPTDYLPSYSAVCGWLDRVRERLRVFWTESLPLFFLVMWVVVIGVAGSAVVLKVLDLVSPAPEPTPEPGVRREDEKLKLLENMETQRQ